MMNTVLFFKQRSNIQELNVFGVVLIVGLDDGLSCRARYHIVPVLQNHCQAFCVISPMCTIYCVQHSTPYNKDMIIFHGLFTLFIQPVYRLYNVFSDSQADLVLIIHSLMQDKKRFVKYTNTNRFCVKTLCL